MKTVIIYYYEINAIKLFLKKFALLIKRHIYETLTGYLPPVSTSIKHSLTCSCVCISDPVVLPTLKKTEMSLLKDFCKEPMETDPTFSVGSRARKTGTARRGCTIKH